MYQAAVWWPKASLTVTRYDRHGQPLMDVGQGAREIRIRMDNRSTEVLTAEGSRIKVDATAFVSTHMEPGDELWMGELNDWVGTDRGQNADTVVYQVVYYDATPDIKNRFVTRKVGLMKKAASRNPDASSS
jgi:hypothetical protein